MAFSFGGFGGGRPMPGGAPGGGMMPGRPMRVAGGPMGGGMPGFGQMGGRAQMAPQQGGMGLPFGQPGRRGGFSPMQQTGGAMQRPGGVSPGMMAGMAALSDAESKTKIRELEDELSRTYAALSGPSATADVQPQAPDTAALDAAYRKPSSNSYDYKDPSIPGAAPGRQAGPMADELRDLPGVVAPGADGLDRVDTGRLTMTNASEIGNLRREMDALLGRTARGDANPDGTY